MKLLGSLKHTRYMQYLAAVTANMSIAASTAVYTTWASPSLPKLTSSESPIGITLTDAQASWVAASFLLGSLPGGLLAGPIVEKMGRRASLILSALPLFVPWIIIIFVKSLWALIIARFIGGIGCGIAVTAVPMYTGEIAEKDIRGKLGSAFNILKLSGSLFVLSVGPFVTYTALNISCSLFPLIFVIPFYFMPESPYYLIKAGKKDAARINLVRLSNTGSDKKQIEEQLLEIEKIVQQDMQNKSTIWEFLSKKEYRKSLILMIGLKTLQQFSGMYAIESYMQSIIEDSGSSISPELSSIICGFIQIPAVLIAAGLVDKMGRKPLLIISALGCAVALIAEGVYFYLQDVVHANLDSVSWLPTTGIMVYLVVNPIGLFTLPYILMGELFATNIKGIAVSISTFYGGLLGFLVVKFYEPISNAWGLYTMFWLFAANCILGSLFTLFVLPETKGKTFAEIQEKLHRNRGTA